MELLELSLILIYRWFEKLPFSIWWRENALRHYSLVRTPIIKVFEFAFLPRHDQEVETVKYFFLCLLPILIMEVVIYPHESLIDHFGHDILFELKLFWLWKLDLLSRSHPVKVDPIGNLLFLKFTWINCPLRLISRVSDHALETPLPFAVWGHWFLNLHLLVLWQCLKHQAQFHQFKFELVEPLLEQWRFKLFLCLMLNLEKLIELLEEAI